MLSDDAQKLVEAGTVGAVSGPRTSARKPMATRIGYSRAVAAVYEAPRGTALPHLAVVLLDGKVITAHPMDDLNAAAHYATEAAKVLQALELSDPDLVIEQDV